MKKILIILVLGATVAAIAFWGKGRFYGLKAPDVQYRLAKVEKRDLVNSVSASGELSAVVTVAVGSEISGQIKELLADYNSQVRKGEIIARIDPERYETLVRQAEAELALSQAKLLTQKATVERCEADLQNAHSLLTAARAQTSKARATLENARRDFERKQTLVKQDFVSKNDFDAAQTAFAEAKAQLEQAEAQENAAKSKVSAGKASLTMARAQIKEAEAQIQLKMAALDKCRVDLNNTIIRSPVDGVVIDRSVDVGQTVAASLQAPTLFTIAQNLSKMQVAASVDEADIGRIKESQTARFTVDAYGSRKFTGRVTQIRKKGKTIQNVVTYTVIVSADNPDLSLMPGMTAEVEIELLKKPQVLAVANAALRFRPSNAKENEPGSSQAAADTVSQAGFQASGGGRRDPEERIRRISEALGLNPDQQIRLREVYQQSRQKIIAARQSGEFDSMRMGALRDKVRKEAQSAIIRILSPQQRDRYEQIVSGRIQSRLQKGTIWHLDQAGRPTPIQVTIGVSDGTYTEISSPGIESNMEVIVGTR